MPWKTTGKMTDGEAPNETSGEESQIRRSHEYAKSEACVAMNQAHLVREDRHAAYAVAACPRRQCRRAARDRCRPARPGARTPARRDGLPRSEAQGPRQLGADKEAAFAQALEMPQAYLAADELDDEVSTASGSASRDMRTYGSSARTGAPNGSRLQRGILSRRASPCAMR